MHTKSSRGLWPGSQHDPSPGTTKSRDGGPMSLFSAQQLSSSWIFLEANRTEFFPKFKHFWFLSLPITPNFSWPPSSSAPRCLGHHWHQLQGSLCYHLNTPCNMRVHRSSTYLQLIYLMRVLPHSKLMATLGHVASQGMVHMSPGETDGAQGWGDHGKAVGLGLTSDRREA